MTRTAALPRRSMPSPGVAAPGDRRFRRPDVRPVGRRRIGRWCWRAGRVVAFVGLLGAAGYGLGRGLLASQVFVVSRVAIRGNTRLSTGEAEALVQGLRGQHILLIDLDKYRRRLMEAPWVAGATLRRVLPATIEVRLVERTPMAVARVGGGLFLVDGDGVIVDEFGPEYGGLDLPVVDGLVPAPADAEPAVDAGRAALVYGFLAALRAEDGLRQRVSQVDVSHDHDVVVLLAGDVTLVHLGDTNFVERLRTYLELAPALRDRLREIDYVDMRFDERVYVKSKGRLAAVGPAGAR